MSIFDELITACGNAHRDDTLKDMDRWVMPYEVRARLLMEADRNNPHPAGDTLFGMRVVVDNTLPEGVVELRGPNGQVARLEGL